MSEMEKLAAKMEQQIIEEKLAAELKEALIKEPIHKWMGALMRLFDDIQFWLQPLAKKGLVEFNRGFVDIDEDVPGGSSIGYKGPILQMGINRRAACIRTQGLYTKGYHGTVEFMAQSKQYLIFRLSDSDTQWFIRNRNEDSSNGVPLNEDSLAQAISHYLDPM
ncbi:hypothetical protein GHO29_19740 [Pseudomonas helleri]|uniref:Uncharacterized protein n=1 Tax=Pseudomonas helleri TaxID=1608996 RepID=A0A7X1Y178_9PSED|nr:hypothetical protein [Pseudomonas helleri]MQU28709.1 hypothetical protein [Pseudomonas helleri]